MASDNSISKNNDDENGISDDNEMELSLKCEKARAKTKFTRTWNNLLFLVEKQRLPSNREIEDACDRMDNAMDSAMDAMASLSKLYMQNKDMDNRKNVIIEMDTIDEDYATAYKAARRCIVLQKAKSSETPEIQTIDAKNSVDFSKQSERSSEDRKSASQERSMDGHTGVASNEASTEVGLGGHIRNSSTLKTNATTKCLTCTLGTPENEYVNEIERKKADIVSVGNDDSIEDYQGISRDYCGAKPILKESRMNAEALLFEPSASNTVPTIEQDLWRQMKRVQIPTFTGDKRQYQSWRAAFLACIDSAPATGEYKLLQLRQYLSGEALKVIDSLGHSTAAYEAAKDRLERKFGGKRRQIALYLEELEQFRQIRPENARDIEEFADVLDVAMINLRETGQHHELGDGSLYTILQRKLPQAMFARYHRWIFENSQEESVIALRTWILQEAEFQTIASETVHGLMGSYTEPTSQPAARYRHQQTFFGETTASRKPLNIPCLECGKKHGVWNCREFIRRKLADRWNVAKRLQLCYRCLAQGHQGKTCPRSQPCGQDGCIKLHHRLLHKPGPIEHKSLPPNKTEFERTVDHDLSKPTKYRDTFLTEGYERTEQTTMVTQSHARAEGMKSRS